MEMYSTDYSGRYPSSLNLLTPNYLKTIPECPAAESVTYQLQTGPKAPFNEMQFEDYYHLQCSGEHHASVSVPTDYPMYTSDIGLIER